MAAEQLYFSVKDLATRYGVSKRTIWRWVSEGHLPKPEELPGNVRRWRKADIERIEQDARASKDDSSD